jgi:regulator of replication initiation timing
MERHENLIRNISETRIKLEQCLRKKENLELEIQRLEARLKNQEISLKSLERIKTNQ